MPLIGRILLLLGGAALALHFPVVTRTYHAETLCSSAPPTMLTVDWSYTEARFADEKTFSELQVVAEVWGIPISERQAHPLLVVSSNLSEGAVIVEAGATEVEPGKFCPSPQAVIVRIQFTNRWVPVAREALANLHAGECVARKLREHPRLGNVLALT